ncbi:MAG TPA: DUF3501 family protein [Rhodospirillales bacterium]|jgi:hypothetical protein|nr:DUF3501 family protein [Rhodospirillales bacterium]
MEAKTQMTAKRWMTAADVTAMEDYARARGARREAIRALKKDRRVAVGPDATFYFECFETMLHQVHEMLFVEKGGAAQLAGELEAYNPLVPQGRELVATFMIEIAEPARRARVLAELGGIEEAITLGIDGETVCAKAERDVDRTTAEGKASAVHFLHFPFTHAQIEAFRRPGAQIRLCIDHARYAHATTIPNAVAAALAGDFD